MILNWVGCIRNHLSWGNRRKWIYSIKGLSSICLHKCVNALHFKKYMFCFYDFEYLSFQTLSVFTELALGPLWTVFYYLYSTGSDTIIAVSLITIHIYLLGCCSKAKWVQTCAVLVWHFIGNGRTIKSW